MEEETLRQEVEALREKLSRAEFEAKAKYEDEIERLKSENEHLTVALDGKLINLQSGDVVFLDTPQVLHNNPGMWMQMAKKYNCVFVSVPAGGVDAIQKQSDDQLRAMGLRKLEETEKATIHERVKNIAIELETAMETVGDSASAEIRSHLFSAARGIKTVEAAVKWLHDNKDKPIETTAPAGAMIGG
jgi:hypothetical protein